MTATSPGPTQRRETKVNQMVQFWSTALDDAPKAGKERFTNAERVRNLIGKGG
jgi:hypothetical protein